MVSKTIIIGAAGAVGKRLTTALANAGSTVIAADRHQQLPGTIKKMAAVCVGGVDVRDADSLGRLFREHADPDTAVWNLASPLSVDTALNPKIAEEVTIGGMKNVLAAMGEAGCRRICFTDSIGSFGGSSPRDGVSARWLVENPTQDPGSDYGLQKRACRELMHEFAATKGGDPRFAVLPGVLHSEPVWGNGTTEYALDALLAASLGKPYVCPVDPEVTLPMVFADDLMRGLLALQFASEDELLEPERGYCIPGLSFNAQQLFEEIRAHIPDFQTSIQLDKNMDKFAKLWPDTLSQEEPLRDLDYEPEVTLPRMVAQVLNAHTGRKVSSRAAFRSIDSCASGKINPWMLEKYVRKYMVRGREKFGYSARRQDLVDRIVQDALKSMDLDQDGHVTIDDFLAWNRINSVENLVDDYIAQNFTSFGVAKEGA